MRLKELRRELRAAIAETKRIERACNKLHGDTHRKRILELAVDGPWLEEQALRAFQDSPLTHLLAECDPTTFRVLFKPAWLKIRLRDGDHLVLEPNVRNWCCFKDQFEFPTDTEVIAKERSVKAQVRQLELAFKTSGVEKEVIRDMKNRLQTKRRELDALHHKLCIGHCISLRITRMRQVDLEEAIVKRENMLRSKGMLV